MVRLSDLGPAARAQAEAQIGKPSARSKGKPRDHSLEDALETQLKQVGLGSVEREHQFHPTRKWRFDFAFVDRKVAVEVDGGVWVQGRHGNGVGALKDMEKTNEAAILGWRVLHVAKAHIESGEAIAWIQRAL